MTAYPQQDTRIAAPPREHTPPGFGPAAVAVLMTLGTALVAGGVLLLSAGADYVWNGSAPTCAGVVMSPGDECLSWGRHGSYDYEQGIVNAVQSGRFLRGIGGVLAGGLGAVLLYAASSFSRRAPARTAALAGLAVLALAAALLLTLDSGLALAAAVCAALAVVVLSVNAGIAVGRAVYYTAGVGLLAGAAVLVADGAVYDFSGRLAGAGPGDDLSLFLADSFRAHGDVARYSAAIVALMVAWRLLRTALDGLPRESVGEDARSAAPATDLEVRHHLILTPLRPAILRQVLWIGAAFTAWGGAAYLASRGAAVASAGAVVLTLLGLAAASRLARPQRTVGGEARAAS